MLTISEIQQFIQDDAASEKKRFARIGQRYYEGDHDIKGYKLYYYDADGELVEDKTRSNIKISHPFFEQLVDQVVQYMMSGDNGFVKSDIPELQSELDSYFNENEEFLSELNELLTGCNAKGFEYMYAYKNADDKISFQCADSLGVVEVRAKDTDDNCEYVIYSYIDRIEKGKKAIKRIQVWDKEQTYFYVRVNDGKIILDESEKLNPRPHTIYKKANGTYYETFGFIPFFRMDNCKKQFSALKPIKELIDDYDLMSCGLSNNLQDASEYLVVVSGFQGDNLEQLLHNVRTKKGIGVDEGGDVNFKTVDIPYEARKTKLELDEKNIFRFGMGFSLDNLKDTNATTNIGIKAAYTLLDLKANKLEIQLKRLLRKLLNVVLAEINQRNGTDYQSKDVYLKFERKTIMNETENAQVELTKAQAEQTKISTLLNLAATLDNETIVQNICEILDLEYADIKEKLPDNEVNLYEFDGVTDEQGTETGSTSTTE